MELDQQWSRWELLGAVPVAKELAESDPSAVAELAVVELELGRRGTAGAVLDRVAQVQCRVDSDWGASVLEDTLLELGTNSPSAEVGR